MSKNFLNKIAVVQMWPEIKAAEDEVIARIVNTCRNLGVEVVLINTAGKLVESPDIKITSNDVDFVIHLHFETPKTYDAFSFVTLWNPLQFYFDWGYRKYSNNIVSHDDFLSCDSACADDHVRRMILTDNTHFAPYFNLFHSMSMPFCKPGLGQQKLFYVGINWDRLGKGKSRHQDLLQALDKSGELVIYGPDIFLGVKVWEGFKSYAGPLPFDGESVINAIDEAGITLVLSSEAHIESELMSSRLFEGLAAGSVIIVDENCFARKNFGDTLLYINTIGVKPEDITSQVRAHISWIKANQEQALEIATKAQQIFKDKFDMALSIKKLYGELPQRKQQLAESFLHQSQLFSLTVIGFLREFSQASLTSIVENFAKQTYEKKKLILFCDECDYENNKDEIDTACQISKSVELKSVSLFRKDYTGSLVSEIRLGKVISEVLDELPEGELVSVLVGNESLFSEHYSSLVRAFEDNENLDIAHTDVLLTHKGNGEKQFFDLFNKIRPFNKEYNKPNGYSRFLFKVKREDWIASTLKYLGWGGMDAIYSKSKTRARVSRASCTIDIEFLQYPSSTMEKFERDMTLVVDSMGHEAQKDFAVESFGDQVLNSTIDSKINLADYSIPERRLMIARLIDALELPRWIRSSLRRIYRLYRRA
jgi:hypothetical protein